MAWVNSRLSTLQMNLFARRQVETATVQLQKASKEMSTGLKADVFADLGPMAAVTLSLRSTSGQIHSYITANGVLDSKIQSMLTAIDTVRETVSAVFQAASVNSSQNTIGTKALQIQAEAALKSMISTMNVNYNGEYLFSGIKSGVPALQNWDQPNPTTGQSPHDAVKAIIGTGPTTVAQANTMIADINAVFASNYSADPSNNYEATFYNGKQTYDANGNPNKRVTARIESNRVLDYGVQANDAAFRAIYKGLAMLTAVDPSKIQDKATYKAWMKAAADALSSGIAGALDVSTKLGFYRKVIDDTVVRQRDMSNIYQSQIRAFEAVDPYKAATQVKALEVQLQASYSISARLSNLTILKYL